MGTCATPGCQGRQAQTLIQMDQLVLRVLLFVVGAIFVGAGGKFVKDSMGAKDLIESSLFGLLGVLVGLFLLGIAFFGPPG